MSSSSYSSTLSLPTDITLIHDLWQINKFIAYCPQLKSPNCILLNLSVRQKYLDCNHINLHMDGFFRRQIIADTTIRLGDNMKTDNDILIEATKKNLDQLKKWSDGVK